MKKILITGGAGFIGTKLSEKLLSLGYGVVILDKIPSRIVNPNLYSFTLDISKDTLSPDIFRDVCGIINLAGVPIFGRFTKKYKDLVYNSRIGTTKKIVDAIEKLEIKPKVLVSASAIGFYKISKNILNEESEKGNDFLAHVCIDWESEAKKAESFGVRTVILRTAHVIGPGGLLSVLKGLFEKWIGGYFGNGMQHMPWIFYQDIIDMYIYAIENNLSGVYNTAVESPTQKDFMNTIRVVTKSPLLWRIPLFAAKLMYLEFADSLTSDFVIDSSKIKKEGFVFSVTNLKDAIEKSL